MKINKGLVRDLAYIDQVVGTWRDGKNFVISSGNIKSEKGFTQYTALDNVIIGVGTLANIIIICSIKYAVNTYSYSEIGIIEDDVYISKIKSSNLNFNISYPIIIEAKYNHVGDIIIAITDNYNTPKLINLTNIPEGLNDNISLVNLFGSYKVPIYKLNSINSSSGSLKSGVYYLGIQYALKDKSYSQTSRLSNPVLIVKDSMSKSWNNFGSCEGGTITSKIIDMEVSNIDTVYAYIRPVIVYKTDTSITAHVGSDINISSAVMNLKISDISTYTTIDLNDVIIPSTSYAKVGAMTALDNVLYLANLVSDADIRYQKYANNIKVEWVYTDEIGLTSTNNSYKDAVILFDKKTFVPDEIYALYIRFIRKDGTKVTSAFHIPGRELVIGVDKAVGTPNGSVKAKTIYAKAQKYHLENTATSNGDGSGLMGAWENETESYPLFSELADKDNDYKGSLDYNGFGIVGGIDIAGQKVRHHKFPSIAYLKTLGLDPVRYNSLAAPAEGTQYVTILDPAIDLNGETLGTATLVYCKFNDMTTSIGTVTYSLLNTRYSNVTAGAYTAADKLNVEINYTISGYARVVDGLGVMSLFVNIIIKDSLGAIKDTIKKTESSQTGDIIFTPNITGVIRDLQVLVGDTISVEAYITKDVDSGAFTQVNFNGSEILMNNVATGAIEIDNTYGKILGLKVSNIQIPQYIKNSCTHFEILYAKRTTANMTVIGNGMLAGKAYNTSGTFPRHSFYSYDILSQNIDIPISHLSVEWSYLNKTIAYGGSGATFDYVDLTYAKDGLLYIPTRSEAYRLIKVTNSGLVQYNQPNNELNNDRMSASLYVDYDDTELYEYNALWDGSSQIKNQFKTVTGIVCNACAFKADLYVSMFDQELVTTGKLINIESIVAEGLVTTPTIYGGDVVYSYYGASVYYDRYISYILAPTFNILNSGLRYSDDANVLTTMFPDYNLILESKLIGWVTNPLTNFHGQLALPTGTPGVKWAQIIALLIIEEIVDFPELYSLNTSDASVNDLVLGLVYNKSNSFVNLFPYRVHRSLPQGSETTTDGWKVFKSSNYYDSENNRGEIYALEHDGADLLILHSSTLFVAQHKDTLNISNEVAVALGQADIFATKPIEIVPDDKGYVGCQSRFAIAKSPIGITIVDRQQRKIFLYFNKQIKEISKAGLGGFFHENLQYADYPAGAIYTILFDGGTTIEFDSGSALITGNTEVTSEINSKVDNPFASKGITSIYDKKHNRFIFTKIHKEIIYGQKQVETQTIVGTITLTGIINVIVTSNRVVGSPLSIPVNVTIGDNDITVATKIVIALENTDAITDISTGNFTVGSTGSDVWLRTNDNAANDPTLNIAYDNGTATGLTSNATSVNTTAGILDINIDTSFSISYYPLLEAWGFRHTYIPSYYFNSRLNTFAVYPNKLFKINDGNIGVYDDGLIKYSYIDIILSDQSPIDKHFLSMIWTSVYKDSASKIQRLKTFDTITIYNEDRFSGEIDLVMLSYPTTPEVLAGAKRLPSGNIRLTSGGWKFNEFRDKLKDKTINILNKNDIEELQIDNSSLSTIDWTEKAMFISPYAIVRLLFKNAANASIELLDFETNSKKVLR